MSVKRVMGTSGVIAYLEVKAGKTTAWDKIAVIFQNHEAWTHAKPAGRTINGRVGLFDI